MKKLEAGGDRHLYTLKGLSVYISSIILLFFLFLEGNSTVENNFNNAIWNNQKTNSTLQTKNKTMVDVSELHPYEENTNQENVWEIEIPTIGLVAPIKEGTTKEIMDEFVGHFEHTALEKGNVGLIAHNRGYPKNYFQNIKDLKIGDKIYYTYKNTTKTYMVEYITIIKDTDWSYLENTEDNRITLITCVENEPEYRRCIQGIENS